MVTAEELRKARKRRLAARAAAEQQEAQCAFNYNPLYQKPTHLGADAPRGGYHYYGPAPDAGTSYGCYAGDDGIGVIMPKNWAQLGKKDEETNAGEECAFHPGTGEKLSLACDLDKKGLDAVMGAADTMIKLSDTEPPMVTSAPIDQMPIVKMYHPATGDDITETVSKQFPGVKADTEQVPNQSDSDNNSNTEETKAVKFEALSAFAPNETILDSDVNATLYAEASVDPYWNIEIKGRPVASIHLADQPKPDEQRALFVSQDYFKGISQAIAKLGPEPVLKQVNARYWANEVDKTILAKRIKEQVKAKYAEKFERRLQKVTDRLLNCIAIVNAGMDKNFFQDQDHPLKSELYAQLGKLGIPASQRMSVIEAAFERGATPYFKTVFEKAIEFMGMEPVALAQVENAIGTADVIKPDVPGGSGTDLLEASAASEDPMNARTLSERLTHTSVGVTSGALPFAVDSTRSIKDQLKNEIKLSGASVRFVK